MKICLHRIDALAVTCSVLIDLTTAIVVHSDEVDTSDAATLLLRDVDIVLDPLRFG